MSFASVKDNQASEKFFLVRMEPARKINSLLTSIGGGKYTATINLNLSRILESGTTLTKVSGTPTSGQYSFNETTKLLTIYPVSISNEIIFYYYLFYTGSRFRVVSEDPENASTTKRDWEPRIRTNPSFSQSVENVIAGKLSISSSSIKIINDDWDFSAYLTDNDSFFNKNIQVWQCLDSTDNIKKAFFGRITGVSYNKQYVTLNIEDSFSALSDDCLCGDLFSESYFNTTTWPNLDPSKILSPIRFIFGSVSKFLTENETVSGLLNAKRVIFDSLNDAVCTDYTLALLNTNNREWGICRAIEFVDFSETTINVNNASSDFTRLTVANTYYTGDTFVISQSGTDYYARVLYFDPVNSYCYINKIGAISTGAFINGNSCPTIVIDAGETVAYCYYGRDYTATESSTSYGNRYLNIDFDSSLETTFGISYLDPTTMQVYYRVRPVPSGHGDALEFLLNSAGIDTSSTSFVVADSTMGAYVNFSIPYESDSSYSPVIEYCQDILSSALGYLSLDENFQVQYGLFSAPTSTDERTDSDIAKNSFSVSVKYKDIIHTINARNPHADSDEMLSKTRLTRKSDEARYLHGVTKAEDFTHVLEDISGRIQAHIDLKSSRSGEYSLDTYTKDLDSEVCQDFLLKKDGVLGGTSQKSVKILSFDRGTDKTQIRATDLLGL